MSEWDKFVDECRCCRRCGLAAGRKNVVIGRGNHEKAIVLFVGEGPGRQEDIEGKAFVGAAGKLLDLLIKALMFNPDDYYIANIVKCRPPGNRNPTEEEAKACLPWLRFQVKQIKPKIVVCLGGVAAKYLIDKNAKISMIRGKWVTKEGFFDIMPTFHPAALLRDTSKREMMWHDMKKVKEKLEYIKSVL